MMEDPAMTSSSSSTTLLAPGFRFHPTDEELVSYYLKRKILNRPLRVDAIAEVDLYKSPPWDLPSFSRLRSRDVEWYFFSPLDRKYNNKSRTNRATAEGYWKTTGKDRAVKHGERVVGMKKTLVFHVGRAPRGERTNWVMHEYRLEDDVLASSGILQDGYVVCRIFQKSGSGPQNGAQYGAPFVEEEWEAEEERALVAVAEPIQQIAEFEEKQEPVSPPHDDTALLAIESDGQVGPTEDHTILLEQILMGDLFDDMGGCSNAPGQQDSPMLATNYIGQYTDVGQQSHLEDNNAYVSLEDFADNSSMDHLSSEDSLGAINFQNPANGVGDTTTFSEGGGIELLDIANETANLQELVQICPPVEGDFNLQPGYFLNPVSDDYPSTQQPEDNMLFYDALGYDVPYTEDNLENSTALQFSPVANLPSFDGVDDLMAYFHDTENDVENAVFPENSQEFVETSAVVQSNSVPEVDGSRYPECKVTPQAPVANGERGTSSSARLGEADKLLEKVKADDAISAPDTHRNSGWKRTISKCAVNMLGSISAPPAMAEDHHGGGKSVSQISATHSSSAIRVTAGMIQIHGLTVMGRAEHWTLQKNGDMDFLISYGMAGNDILNRSASFEPSAKIQVGGLSMMLRGGFNLFCLSMLVLTVSLKVGMCVFSK